MVFNVLLYAALIIFLLGMLHKISTWFSRKIGMAADQITTAQRVSAAIKGIAGVIFSLKCLVLIKVYILDVLLQRRILREDALRWVMHMLIYGGFMLLLLMHALDDLITIALFDDYYSTLNPFFFLRNFFGLWVIAGLAIAVYRRFVLKIPRLKTNPMDGYAIAILAIIMISGIALEGLKITSHSAFEAMQEDYAALEDEIEIEALESYWVEHYGVISPKVKRPFGQEILTQGQELHEANCAECHSPPQWAFAGYTTAKVISPFAGVMDRIGGVTLLWYIHILACFCGLAYLPFSKMFHIFASQISILANAVMDKDTSAAANVATRQIMELDACTHCGTCNERCSVAVAFEKIGNFNILPAEKLQFLKAYAADKDIGPDGLKAIQEGIYLCTNCDRCTVACPVGINLKDLWFDVREELIQKEQVPPLLLSPFSFYRGLNQKALDTRTYSAPVQRAKISLCEQWGLILKPRETITLSPSNGGPDEKFTQTLGGETYAYCFACENCTTVCPVVENYANPQETLGLLPHQIMRSVGLGLKDLALGSKMLWDCLTCYQCQEHCPQKVMVTEIFYELKNVAFKEMRMPSGSSDLEAVKNKRVSR